MPDNVVVSSSGTLTCQPWAGNKLVSIVARLAGLSNDTTLRAGVLDMLNIAIQEFDLAHDWSFREETAANITVSSGTATYTLPSDFKRIYDVRLIGTNERTLYPLDRRGYDRFRAGDQDPTSVPTHYHLYGAFDGAIITLVPIPSVGETLQIRYYKTFSALTDDASSDLCIPHRAIVPIIYKAAALTLAWKSPELSTLWEAKYGVALARCIADDTDSGDSLEGFSPKVDWAGDANDPLYPNDLLYYPR